ncbi:MAG: anti-sigma factor domain-containing protein [Aestuariivirga sp.]
MAAADEREGLAAEYVLGTLSAAERHEAETLAATDASFAALIAAWERRLSPLATALEPQDVPPEVRGRVMKAIAGDTAESESVVALGRKVRLWKGVSAGAAALAAVLAGVLFLKPPPDAPRYVAVLQTEGPGPAFLASVDLAKGTISVRTVTAELPAGKSFELWAVGGGRDKPQSLGLIDASFRVPATRLGDTGSKTLGETVFAVSLEPEGGSPTGQPTGPVLYTGKLVAAE